MKLNICIKYLLAIALATALASCSETLDWFDETEGTVKNPFVEILDEQQNPTDEVSAVYNGEYIAVRVKSNTSWIATVDGASKMWCSVNPPSTSGDSRLLIRVMPHTTIRPRQAIITVMCGENIKKTLTLTQEGTPLLSMNVSTMAMVQSSQMLGINADIDEGWIAEVTQGSDWLSISKNEGAGPEALLVKAATNNSGAEKIGKIVVKTGLNQQSSEYTITDELVVTQNSEMDALIVTVQKDDTLRIKWNRILGASGYELVATEHGTSNVVETLTFGQSDTTYLFEPIKSDGDNIVEGDAVSRCTKLLDIVIKAITEVAEITPSSAATEVHPLFDETSGNGTSAANAFKISQRRHLNNIRYALKGYFVQSNDIDLADWGENLDPDLIKRRGNFTPIDGFAGTYDGNNVQIKNMVIINTTTTPDTYTTGLFSTTEAGTAAKPIVIKNVCIVNPIVERYATGAGGAAAIVGKLGSYGNLINCKVEAGNVLNLGSRTAAVAGDCDDNTLISRCTNTGKVNGGLNNTAGILGTFSKGPAVVEYCINYGEITGRAWSGGITGSTQAGTIVRYCANFGTITGDSECGGVYGRGLSGAAGNALVSGCYNTGAVTVKNTTAGGIGGTIHNPTTYVENCYNSGAVTGKTMAAGIVSAMPAKTLNAGVIKNCYNVGIISYGGVIGSGSGIAGTAASNAANVRAGITGCFYLNSSAMIGAPYDIEGVVSKSDAEMKEFSTFSAWSSEEWSAGDDKYPYPQLIKAPR